MMTFGFFGFGLEKLEKKVQKQQHHLEDILKFTVDGAVLYKRHLLRDFTLQQHFF